MKRKNALIMISVVLVIVLVLTVGFLYFQGKLFATPAKLVEVSNLSIGHDESWSNCYLTFIVDNLYNSPVTAIGSKVNGIIYEYSNLTVPAGQTVGERLVIPKLVITNSTNYNTTVTFTFNNGQYQSYSENILPPKYVGSFYITDQSLTITLTNSTLYSLTIENTGNIPIVNANYTIDNYQLSLPLEGSVLLPQKTLSLNGQSFPASLQKGVNYDCNTYVGFIDGSTSSAISSVFALSDETQKPTPTPDTQATPSP